MRRATRYLLFGKWSFPTHFQQRLSWTGREDLFVAELFIIEKIN